MAATPKTEQRTIKHALFSYALPSGGEAIAFRGQTIDLLSDDITRGEKFGAFTAGVGELPTSQGSLLPAYPVDNQVEQDAWIVSGSEEEILSAVNAQPEIVDSVIAAEARRGDAARKPLLESLALLVNQG